MVLSVIHAKKSTSLRLSRIARLLLLVVVVFLLLGSGAPLAKAASDDNAANPRANFWRAVRQGVDGETTARGQDRGVLIQNGGENWRRIRNGLVAGIGPWVLAAVFLMIALFFLIKGQDKLEEPPSGEMLDRWSSAERWLHWVTALLFIVMAITGLSMLFGRAVLIPVFGHRAFSGYLGAAMQIHNYAGPFFLALIVIEAVAWVRENIPKRMDLVWFKTLGGMIGHGPRPHAEKINGGAKGWFWAAVLAGLTVGVTGVIMDFPNLGTSRWVMQVVNIIHATVAILFVAGSLGHIYIGTIGAQGTFEGMWTGRVSAQWAKQHQDLWYADQVKTGSQGASPR